VDDEVHDVVEVHRGAVEDQVVVGWLLGLAAVVAAHVAEPGLVVELQLVLGGAAVQAV
jgi:hypothetical protein